MNILFFQWHSFMNKGIERALQELQITYDTFFYQQTDWEKDPKLEKQLREKLSNRVYDAVLSVNFAPIVSNVCESMGIRYVAWVYDSPTHIRNVDVMKNSCNEIYFFDRGQAEELKKQGIQGFHMPLAVDTEVFGETIRKSGTKKKYTSDIALVGQLYQTDYAYFTSVLPEYERGYLEGILTAQSKVYGGYLIPELVTDKLLGDMNRIYQKIAQDGFLMGRRELEYMLACEVTGRERFLATKLLSNHFEMALYSGKKDDRLTQTDQRGYADYYSEMPLIFANSRINLNISLKTIRTGIPLRVIDILGCGGFVLTNMQQELYEHFSVGQELEVYENIEDLFQKTKFYLEHDEIRKQIARNGFEKARKEFGFKDRIQKMLRGKDGV